jgi:heat shock protein HslJ
MTYLSLPAALAAALLAVGCTPDETLAGFADPATVWTLTEIDGSPVSAPTSLQFPEPGRIAGHAPCNRFSGTVTAPYPWFATGPLAATRRACPDLAAEGAFFAALGEMTESEVSGPVLILRNSELGREMVFRAAP